MTKYNRFELQLIIMSLNILSDVVLSSVNSSKIDAVYSAAQIYIVYSGSETNLLQKRYSGIPNGSMDPFRSKAYLRRLLIKD
jgi:hypothetical protein